MRILYQKTILNSSNIEFVPTLDRAQQSAKSRLRFHRKNETLPIRTPRQGLDTRRLQPQASIQEEWADSS